MIPRTPNLLALIFGLLLATTSVAAEPDRTKYTDKQFAEDEKLLLEVAGKLLEKMDPVPDCVWPPKVYLARDDKLPEKERFNAFAYFDNDWEKYREGDKLHPRVKMTFWYMRELVQGRPDVCALVVGHELGHIYHKHPTPRSNPGQTAFIYRFYSKEMEIQADRFGAELLVKAGYSLKKALTGDEVFKNYTIRHSGIDALTSTHPGWLDRYAIMAKDPTLWRSMNAFLNGVALLNTEQYAAAEFCFDRVLDEFPRCHEALVNVGYACLMQYCDGLTADELKDYAVGQVMCGGFYQRAKSLEPPVRGKNTKLWDKAVRSFREALKLKPDLALAKANLGLAYLFHPEGKQSDKASEYLQEAVAALEADKTMDPLTRAATLVNLGAAQLAEGERKEGLAMLDKAVALAKKIEGGQAGMVRGAILYQQAMARSDTKEADVLRQAADQFELYLKSNDPLSAWWKLAFERYVALCKAVKREPNTEASFKKGLESQLRIPAGLILEGNLKVTLAEPIADVLKRLGPAKESPVVGPALKRYSFEKYGIDILGGDQVIAIILTSKSPQVIKLQTSGIGGAEVIELRIGTSQTELKQKMPGFESYVSRELLAPEIYFHYYRHLGIALRYDKHPTGKISELMLVRIPEPTQ